MFMRHTQEIAHFWVELLFVLIMIISDICNICEYLMDLP